MKTSLLKRIAIFLCMLVVTCVVAQSQTFVCDKVVAVSNKRYNTMMKRMYKTKFVVSVNGNTAKVDMFLNGKSSPQTMYFTKNATSWTYVCDDGDGHSYVLDVTLSGNTAKECTLSLFRDKYTWDSTCFLRRVSARR